MSFGISVRNGLAVGLLASTFLSSRSSRNIPASLILNFTDGIYRSSGRNYAFSSIITFSRTTNATLVDATGKLTYAPNNLVTNSEAFENAAWGKGNASIAANIAVAPNGTTTADKLIEDTATSTHLISQFNPVANTTYTFSVYAKASGRSRLVFQGGGFAALGYNAIFDLASGTMNTNTGGRGSITDVGNGWYRCSVNFTASNTSLIAWLMLDNSNNSTYTGDGVSGVLLWGAQYEQVTYQTAPSTYNSTSPANLLGFTEEFDNAAWSKSSVTVTVNATTSPDGTTNADAIIENTAVSAFHFVGQTVTKSAANIPVAGSFYLKNKGRQVSFNIQNAAGSSGVQGRVNPATGTVTQNATAFGSGFTAGTISISDVGNGWYRVAMTATTDTSTSVSFQLILHNGTSTVYTGDGVSGAFLWGAQLSSSASLDPYVYNPAAAPTSIAYYGPRFDYNPVTLAANGLLIEEQRTNLILRSQELTAADWTAVRATISANTTVAPDGTLTAETVTQTTGQTTSGGVLQNVTVAIQLNTISAFFKKGSKNFAVLRTSTGTVANAAWFNIDTGVVGSKDAGISSSSIQNFGNGWYRCSITTTPGVTAMQFQFYHADTDNSLTVVDSGSTSVWGAQIEAGAFPTSYIPTVASTVTRAVDVASMLGSNFSSWYNQSEGTLFAQALTFNSGTGKYPWSVHNGTGTELIAPYFLNANGGGFVVDGTTQAQIETAGLATLSNIALAVKLNDFAMSINGNPVATDNAGTMPTPDQMQIGNRADGTRTLNGHIRRITYYPTRLTNAQLQALTA